MWSTSAQILKIAEHIVPWEIGMEAVFVRKKAKYTELTVKRREVGWMAVSFSVVLGCRGFIGLWE